MRILTEYTATEQYRESLDEVYGTVTIAGLEYDTSRAMEALDPVAFRCGFVDYCDTYGIEIGDEDQDEDTDEWDDACCERGAETDGAEHTPGWCVESDDEVCRHCSAVITHGADGVWRTDGPDGDAEHCQYRGTDHEPQQVQHEESER